MLFESCPYLRVPSSELKKVSPEHRADIVADAEKCIGEECHSFYEGICQKSFASEIVDIKLGDGGYQIAAEKLFYKGELTLAERPYEDTEVRVALANEPMEVTRCTEQSCCGYAGSGALMKHMLCPQTKIQIGGAMGTGCNTPDTKLLFPEEGERDDS